MPRLRLFVCITCVATHSVHVQRTVTDCVRITLPHPEIANPGLDFGRAIGRHNLRFVGVAGYAFDVPAVAYYQTRYWKTNGVKVMAWTCDVGDLPFNEQSKITSATFVFRKPGLS